MSKAYQIGKIALLFTIIALTLNLLYGGWTLGVDITPVEAGMILVIPGAYILYQIFNGC